MTVIQVSPSDLQNLSARALQSAGASFNASASVAKALVLAERDGIPSHGVSRIPYYVAHLKHGRVNGRTEPDVIRTSISAARVDARHGFAYPAIEAGIPVAKNIAEETGIAALAIGRSHHCGVLGHHVETLAQSGFVALMFANAGRCVAGPGGKRAVFGTNPFAFACPRSGEAPLVIDLSMSVVARGRIVRAAGRGEQIPEGWAFGPDGQGTIDPAVALSGTLAAIGGTKGAVLAMAIDILAGALTGSSFSSELSSHFETGPGAPFANGQLMILISPRLLGIGGFGSRVEDLCRHMLEEPDVRLPGERRLRNRARALKEGVSVAGDLLAELRRLAEPQVATGEDVRDQESEAIRVGP